MNSIHRGDIFYVEPYPSVGSEQRSGRPAIVVSNDMNNKFSSTVEVVFLTTKSKNKLPTHVKVYGTGRESTALCEQVQTADITRLSSYCGSCTNDEMTVIDMALMVSLGLEKPEKDAIDEEEEPQNDSKELVAVKAQRDLIQAMYNDLLKKVIGKVVA